MSDLTLVLRSEIECFVSVKLDWNTKILQKVQKFVSFEKKKGFFS